MKGPLTRLINSQGSEYTVRNATGGEGRDVPSYSDDGTLTGVLERRGTPQAAVDSGGEEVETDLEIRTANENNETIRPAGTADEYPTKLQHPDGHSYTVLQSHPEDSEITVLTVIRD